MVPNTKIDGLGRWAKSAALVFILGKILALLVKQGPLSQIALNWRTRFACCATTGKHGNIIIPSLAGIAGWMRFRVHASRSNCDILTAATICAERMLPDTARHL